MTVAVDCVVIGAGVVGLACARSLAAAGLEVIVLERHDHIGEETSSRNSEVIHAGIYYPQGSLKAALCVAGKHALYRYCDERSIGFRQCGKIIVAAREDQRPVLDGYRRSAQHNGAGELTWLSAAEIRELEPEVAGVAGLWSPTTGIIDSHAFMLSLQGDLEASGGTVAFNTPVLDMRREGAAVRLETPELALQAALVVNSAGHAAPGLAARLDASAPSGTFARGHYYGYRGRPPFSRLVYPVAEPGGLGVHVTLDLAGQVKFGPDVEWCDSLDYSFDDTRKPGFVAAIRRYFPAVEAARLQPDYVGVRPKISGPGEPAADFRIDGPHEHGVPGLINLLGIESPGLTASLAIARRVCALATGAAA